ncbi:hypothetical protein ACFL54_08170 [Planctomycetota bacterium]
MNSEKPKTSKFKKALSKAKESASKTGGSTKKAAVKAGAISKSTVSKSVAVTKDASTKAIKIAKDAIPAALAFLSLPELLKWSEGITKSLPTIYDKALDATYLKTHIGGGHHRMFDGGHDVISAWNIAKDAAGDDTFKQEVIGYVSALWKDVTTAKGLPLATWSKDNFDSCAEWVSLHIPGASKEWFYDLMSFDAFEILSTSLSSASALFFLSKNDVKRLSEILGSMGILTVIGANPLMGIAVVFCTAYSYFIKKHQLDKKELAKGATLAGVSAAIFSVLGMPVLIEFGVVIVATKIIRDQVFDNDECLAYIKSKAANITNPGSIMSLPKSIAQKFKTNP